MSKVCFPTIASGLDCAAMLPIMVWRESKAGISDEAQAME